MKKILIKPIKGMVYTVNHYKDNDQNIKLLEELAVSLDISLNLIKDDESKQVQHALDRLFNEFNRQLNKLVTGK